MGIVCFPLLAHAEKTALTTIQFKEVPAATQLQVGLSQPVKIHVFALSHPDRLVMDFANTDSTVKMASVHFANPDIKTIRSGNPKAGVLRVVIEMKTSLKSYHVMSELNTKQFIVEFVSPSTRKMQPQLKAQAEKKVASSIVVAKSVQTANKAIEQPVKLPETVPVSKQAASIPAPASISSSEIYAKPIASFDALPALPPTKHSMTIVIDPGHGGRDPGAVGVLGAKEKDIVLAISRQLAALINQQPGMRAVLTRTGDYFVPLRDRLKLARKGKADLFIAIHADSYFNKRSHGVSIYALSQRGATSEAAHWLARRDNDSELGGVDLSELGDQSYLLRSVLIDLAQTATITDSLHLGASMLKALNNITKLHYSRVEQAPFVVLKSPDIPSVLVETGFLSNADEEMRLRSKSYQNKIAQALFDGIYQYNKKYVAMNR